LSESSASTVQIDCATVGEVVGFSDYDGLVEALRERTVVVGLSYRVLEEIAGMPEGGVAKYLSDARVRHFSVDSLLQISGALGIRALFVTDEALLRRMRPMWEKRDELRAHARRRAPSGPRTLRRVRPAVLSELGKAGATARNAKLRPEVRSALAQMAARARWRKRPPSTSSATPTVRPKAYHPKPPATLSASPWTPFLRSGLISDRLPGSLLYGLLARVVSREESKTAKISRLRTF
jgi:hypothetical protein